jgi:folate-binding protein YgfZ
MKLETMMIASEFETSVTRVRFIDRSDRVRLEIKGPDRAKFLHNLTTNEIKRLAVGRGCETFVTSPQGKTIGFMIVLAAAEQIVVRADPGGAVLAMPHFHKYGVFDDVSIDDRSAATFELHVFGPEAAEVARRAAGALPETVEYAHILTDIGGRPVRLVRESPSGSPGYTVIGELADASAIKAIVVGHGRDLGMTEVDTASFDILRIETGTPVFGKEITEKNLPQEFGRDDRAISFVKGCYLGQETVARIDALGHVNQVLKGLRFESGASVFPPGTVLEHDGKQVGVVTSAVFSPARHAGLGLALIKTTHSSPGTRLNCKPVAGTDMGSAIVSDLPMLDRP